MHLGTQSWISKALSAVCCGAPGSEAPLSGSLFHCLGLLPDQCQAGWHVVDFCEPSSLSQEPGPHFNLQ